MYVSLQGNNYSNNSLVNLTEIGDNKTTALICRTNITSCCKQSVGSKTKSDWRYPGGNEVKSRRDTVNQSFTRSRGDGTVFLYRENMSLSPIGIYSCEIMIKKTNAKQELQVGIYPTDKGKGMQVHLCFYC